MKKPSILLTALLLAMGSVAYAQSTGNPPPKPVTGEGAATTVSTNPAATESGGKADEGLDNAEQRITEQQRERLRHRERERKHEGSAQRGERPARGERPSPPERPTMPERPGR